MPASCSPSFCPAGSGRKRILAQAGGPLSAASAGEQAAKPTDVTATMHAKRNDIIVPQPLLCDMATGGLFPTARHLASPVHAARRPARSPAGSLLRSSAG